MVVFCPQETWIVKDYVFRMPDVMKVAIQTGDYALRSELLQDDRMVLELWIHVGVIRV
jgi:hypothetical protein